MNSSRKKKQRAFLEFVLENMVDIGVEELEQKKVT
jgi:hypothetical protein